MNSGLILLGISFNKLRNKMKREKLKLEIRNCEMGFTLIEAILYVAIVSLVLTALIPFGWTVIETGSQSAVEQEVSGNARYISERILYEIRNSLGINNVSSTQIVLCETSGACATSPTTITYSTPNVTIQNKGASAVNLNSNDTTISSLTFTNNTSGTSTKNISFVFTAKQKYTGARYDFSYSTTVQSSAEVRSN